MEVSPAVVKEGLAEVKWLKSMFLQELLPEIIFLWKAKGMKDYAEAERVI